MSTIGKALIIIGLLCSLYVTSSKTLVLGVFLFLLGTIVFLSTNNSWKSKLLWALLPILLWLPLSFGFLMLNTFIADKKGQKRAFIIPNNFIGVFKIVESKCGIKPPVKDGIEQFFIPENGIYLYNGKFGSGSNSESYFFIDEHKEQWPASATGGGSRGTFEDGSAYISINIDPIVAYDPESLPPLNKTRLQVLDSLRVACKKALD